MKGMENGELTQLKVVLQVLSAHQVYMKILGGSTRWLDQFYLYTISLGVIVMAVGGIWTLRSYNVLKKRYVRLSELEKTLGD